MPPEPDTKFPSGCSKQEIINIIFDVVKDGKKLPEHKEYPDIFIMEKNIDFGKGRESVVKVVIQNSGKILTAYSIKDFSKQPVNGSFVSRIVKFFSKKDR